MARLVSPALVKGLLRSSRPSRTTAVSQLVIQQFMNYSSDLGGAPDAYGDSTTSRVAADPDTHQDFQPTSKSSGTPLHDIVAQDVKENPVMIYMKGHPDAPSCGFSALAVKILQQYGVRITYRDILTDLKLKESVKAHTEIHPDFLGEHDGMLVLIPLNHIAPGQYLEMERIRVSNWPTFPQIFIKGECVGGSDIILNMHQKGELKDLLGDIAQKGGQNDAT